MEIAEQNDPQNKGIMVQRMLRSQSQWYAATGHEQAVSDGAAAIPFIEWAGATIVDIAITVGTLGAYALEGATIRQMVGHIGREFAERISPVPLTLNAPSRNFVLNVVEGSDDGAKTFLRALENGENLVPIQGAKGRSPWTADLSHITGKTAESRNRAINSIIREDLPDLNLTFQPQYSPFASQGVAHRGLGTQIGKSPFMSRQALRDTILHEELHHRWWERGIEGWHHSPDQFVPNERFYDVLSRYKRMRGWE